MNDFDVTNISATAVLTAKMRALETDRPTPLISDPYAALLVEQSGLDMSSLNLTQVTGQRLFESNVVRTHFLDGAVKATAEHNIRQLVILGAGLDTRAARLGLSADCVVYEVDQLEVIAYKKRVFAEHGVAVDVDWRPRGGDLEGNWLNELTTVGFDPSIPTAWIVEGVLFYLTEQAVAQLIETVTEHSVSGSELLAVHFGAGALIEAQSREMAAAAGNAGYGFKSTVTDPVAWLDGYGWDTDAQTFSSAAQHLGQTSPTTSKKARGERSHG